LVKRYLSYEPLRIEVDLLHFGPMREAATAKVRKRRQRA
jgi:hypothetical protein